MSQHCAHTHSVTPIRHTDTHTQSSPFTHRYTRRHMSDFCRCQRLLLVPLLWQLDKFLKITFIIIFLIYYTPNLPLALQMLLPICFFLTWKNVNVCPNAINCCSSAAPYHYLPTCPDLDPHIFDQWPTKCWWPLPEAPELHVCTFHQIGVPANQNTQRWPHDSDTQWPQRYRSNRDKTGELLFFSGYNNVFANEEH